MSRVMAEKRSSIFLFVPKTYCTCCVSCARIKSVKGNEWSLQFLVAMLLSELAEMEEKMAYYQGLFASLPFMESAGYYWAFFPPVKENPNEWASFLECARGIRPE